MKAAALVLVLILAGCATTPRPPTAEIPVPVPCPPPPPLSRPALPIAQLSADSPAPVVMRAYAASVNILQGYARQLEMLLSGYRVKAELNGNHRGADHE